jgi:prepilin-type N-terminal cleavage/methylation domain-containing protein
VKRTESSGVTMMELLIVMGILALLVAIITPTFLAVRERARIVKCRVHLHQISLAVKAYQRDHQGRLPVWLHDLYLHYLDSPSVFLCPSDASHPTGSAVDGITSSCPSKTQRYHVVTSTSLTPYRGRGGWVPIFKDNHPT